MPAALSAAYPADLTPLPADYTVLSDTEQARALLSAHTTDRASWQSLRATALRCAATYAQESP